MFRPAPRSSCYVWRAPAPAPAPCWGETPAAPSSPPCAETRESSTTPAAPVSPPVPRRQGRTCQYFRVAPDHHLVWVLLMRGITLGWLSWQWAVQLRLSLITQTPDQSEDQTKNITGNSYSFCPNCWIFINRLHSWLEPNNFHTLKMNFSSSFQFQEK